MTARLQKITVSFCYTIPSQKPQKKTSQKNPTKTIKKLLKYTTKIYQKPTLERVRKPKNNFVPQKY
jgi:hypothetical protein